MWVFLVTEIMFFGGIFARLHRLPRAASTSRSRSAATCSKVNFGATNTVVLIGSCLTMALAIHAAQAGKSKEQ